MTQPLNMSARLNMACQRNGFSAAAQTYLSWNLFNGVPQYGDLCLQPNPMQIDLREPRLVRLTAFNELIPPLEHLFELALQPSNSVRVRPMHFELPTNSAEALTQLRMIIKCKFDE